MEQEMVLISKPLVDMLLVQLTRAEYYCAHAKSMNDPSIDLLECEPTATYAGASGYAGATLRSAIQTLESAVEPRPTR